MQVADSNVQLKHLRGTPYPSTNLWCDIGQKCTEKRVVVFEDALLECGSDLLEELCGVMQAVQVWESNVDHTGRIE